MPRSATCWLPCFRSLSLELCSTVFASTLPSLTISPPFRGGSQDRCVATLHPFRRHTTRERTAFSGLNRLLPITRSARGVSALPYPPLVLRTRRHCRQPIHERGSDDYGAHDTYVQGWLVSFSARPMTLAHPGEPASRKIQHGGKVFCPVHPDGGPRCLFVSLLFCYFGLNRFLFVLFCFYGGLPYFACHEVLFFGGRPVTA